ncbi:TPA: restriction endonuclease subunit S, partial [Streptococcus pneumoniae]
QKYILPPLALQNEFADFVALVDKSQIYYPCFKE